MSKRKGKEASVVEDNQDGSESDERASLPVDEKPKRSTLPWRNTTGALYANYYITPAVLILVSVVYVYFNADAPIIKARSSKRTEGVLLSTEDLAKHDGSQPDANIYIAILGKVYDVEKGRRFYGPGTGYHVFAGRDSTPSFVTGMFDRAKATDDCSNLKNEDLLGIKGWMEFYQKDYKYVGKVVGRYYDAQGKPTAALKEARHKMKEGERERERQKQEDVKFPGCNSKWSQAEGAEVWCSQNSAGIQREWAGVPRMLFKPGAKQPRCVCVRTTGPSSDAQEGSEGDLNHPNLKPYLGCGILDHACKLEQS